MTNGQTCTNGTQAYADNYVCTTADGSPGIQVRTAVGLPTRCVALGEVANVASEIVRDDPASLYYYYSVNSPNLYDVNGQLLAAAGTPLTYDQFLLLYQYGQIDSNSLDTLVNYATVTQDQTSLIRTALSNTSIDPTLLQTLEFISTGQITPEQAQEQQASFQKCIAETGSYDACQLRQVSIAGLGILGSAAAAVGAPALPLLGEGLTYAYINAQYYLAAAGGTVASLPVVQSLINSPAGQTIGQAAPYFGSGANVALTLYANELCRQGDQNACAGIFSGLATPELGRLLAEDVNRLYTGGASAGQRVLNLLSTTSDTTTNVFQFAAGTQYAGFSRSITYGQSGELRYASEAEIPYILTVNPNSQELIQLVDEFTERLNSRPALLRGQKRVVVEIMDYVRDLFPEGAQVIPSTGIDTAAAARNQFVIENFALAGDLEIPLEAFLSTGTGVCLEMSCTGYHLLTTQGINARVVLFDNIAGTSGHAAILYADELGNYRILDPRQFQDLSVSNYLIQHPELIPVEPLPD
ncbi:hypothetical protein C4579_02360 [Candidatus Microgenomates bacterium]|nr:MAG: hypothetical protein C4579_02360 [Candidatus Microgenomates bacterium]